MFQSSAWKIDKLIRPESFLTLHQQNLKDLVENYFLYQERMNSSILNCKLLDYGWRCLCADLFFLFDSWSMEIKEDAIKFLIVSPFVQNLMKVFFETGRHDDVWNPILLQLNTSLLTFFSIYPYEKKHSMSSPCKTMYTNCMRKPKNSPVAWSYKQLISFASFVLHSYVSIYFGWFAATTSCPNRKMWL